jgi:hypothetical protein
LTTSSVQGAYIILNLVVATILAKFNVNQAQVCSCAGNLPFACSITMRCIPLPLKELEALRARKERLAEIRAAELEEQSLAVSKARVVVELKVLSAQQKLRLRRASQEGEVLSSGAADAAAAVEAGRRASGIFGALEEEAALGSPLDEPAVFVPHGVMRRRVAPWPVCASAASICGQCTGNPVSTTIHSSPSRSA